MKNLTVFFAFMALCSYVKAQSYDLLPEKSFTKGIEGPATAKNGNIFAVNYAEEGTIGVVTPKGEHKLYLKLPEGSIGNGIQISKAGEMLVADYTGHNILKVTPWGVSVLAHEPKMNQPNDIALADNGNIYASDPNWKELTGQIWLIRPTGQVELIEKNMGATNGIEVSPDNRALYVGESNTQSIWCYTIGYDGKIRDKFLFHKFNDNLGMDGMRCTSDGKLYVTRYDKGTVAVISPFGTLLEEYTLKGKQPTNITFSPDYRKAYITVADRGTIEVIDIQ